jgi:hypothetical protein
LDDATNIFNLIMGGGGLTSTIVAAHLHKAPVGVSGGIVRDLGVPGTFPQNTFGATFINQALDSQLTLADLVSGLIYVNVHTVNFPNGEIRGQFRELLPIPEPGTLALVGVGLLMFAGSALRRRSSS